MLSDLFQPQITDHLFPLFFIKKIKMGYDVIFPIRSPNPVSIKGLEYKREVLPKSAITTVYFAFLCIPQ